MVVEAGRLAKSGMPLLVVMKRPLNVKSTIFYMEAKYY